MKNPPNFLVCFAILICLIILEMLLQAGFYDSGIDFGFYNPGVLVIANGIVFSLMMHTNGLTLRQLFHPCANSLTSTLVILLPLIALVIFGLMGWLVDLFMKISFLMPEDQWAQNSLNNMMQGGFLTIILLCVMAPFLEEILFRGLMLRGLLHHHSPQKAILLSALLFAMAHFNLYQFPTAFVMGIFFGWLYYLSHSLWPSIVAHALYNGGIYLIGLQGDVYQFNDFSTNLVSLIVSVVGIVLIARVYNIRLRR